MIQQTIVELKEQLLGKVFSEDELKNYLLSKVNSKEFVNAIIGEMLRTPGFSFMNGNVTYRGADYVELLPPNQPR